MRATINACPPMHRAGSEWREIARRSRDGKRELAQLGILPHSSAKFGWDIIGRKQSGSARQGHAVLNEKEASVAREIFQWRRTGMATYSIAKRLNDDGI